MNPTPATITTESVGPRWSAVIHGQDTEGNPVIVISDGWLN